tara:strand:- start:57 stop:191 length:135 start_codon:yes stop_codon:yes gene_type:complete
MDQEELELIRQMSDAPTLILMFVIAFIFILAMMFEEVGRSSRSY